MTKLFGHWIFCIHDNCPESGGGKCRMGNEPVDYPADGKCLFPEYVEYDKEWEKHGAFETGDGEAKQAEMKITVSRKEGVTKEYIYLEDEKPLEFNSVNEAIWFLVEHNYSTQDLLNLDFNIEEVQEK